MPEAKPDVEILRRARRVMWACGLCFTLLFLMGLTGLASITISLDDPMSRVNRHGFEGEVAATVSSLEGLIRFIHTWGGYAGIVLAGWAGIEVFRFARQLRKSDEPEWRTSARRLAPLGLLGSAALIASLLLLIPSGVAARLYWQGGEQAVVDGPPNPQHAQKRVPEEFEVNYADKNRMAELHEREFNYLLVIGAFMLMFAVSSTRKIQLEVKKQKHVAPATGK